VVEVGDVARPALLLSLMNIRTFIFETPEQKVYVVT
jgi:hypothetical protein